MTLISVGISTLVLILTIAILAYVYMTRNFDYWKKRGVPYIQPKPFFGNIYELATFKTCLTDGFKSLYDQIDSRYIGLYILDTPVLMLKCPKLIHQVLIKDCANFTDRTTARGDHDVMTSNILFLQKGQDWKQTRAKLSPVFSPVKLKRMFSLVDDISLRLLNKFNEEKVINTKKVFDQFSTEVMCRCLFGISTDCIDNEDSEFIKEIQKFYTFSLKNSVSQISYFIKPDLVKRLKVDLVQRSVVDYIRNILLETLEARKKSPEQFGNLIDIFKEMQNNNNEISTSFVEEILGNAVTFFYIGTDTISTFLSFVLHALTLHQDIQGKLRNEIKKIVTNDESFTFEKINRIKLLDMCIYETLRKYPLGSHTCRRALHSYTFPGTNLTIEEGTSVYIPLCGLHMDEKYFPNPDKFDPYRFEHQINEEGQLYFIPFGHGPRYCIGERFALMVTKTFIIKLLLKFKLEKSSATAEVIEFEKKTFFVKPKTKIELSLKPI